MMDALAAFHFLRPWWLLLLLPALALWWLERRETDTTARWRAAIDPALLRHLIVGGDTRRFKPSDLLLAGWIVGVLAIAGPAWRQAPSPFAQSARPAMFVLKVAPSMLGTDLQPTRLDRARQKMSDLLALREGAPTGLVAYAGSAHLVLPPTPDAAVVETMAGALAPDVMPREGDDLAAAVKLAGQVLTDGRQGGSIVVFADTVAPGAIAALKDERDVPVTLFAMQPAARVSADPSLNSAVSALDADLVVPTLDTADVAGLARTLATKGAAPPLAGEAPRWEEAGYWLTPLIALLVLGWFRRGWVLA
ncbi:VWA domain-containing protein [Starkeya sp. ORNL1]|uniref:vWA domain-containing protein n=1 Tax=Starkeya sp. ORNL1 TaxID=2709380 RepID=UPI001FEE09D4|nr:VWA domain-containing protein [Starkeya sp. ORNL1]